MIESTTGDEGPLADAGGRGMGFIHAINAAAAVLQQATTSEAEVYAAVRQQIVELGLRGALSLVNGDGSRLTLRAVAMPRRWQALLNELEAVAGLRSEGFAMPVAGVPEFEQVLL